MRVAELVATKVEEAARQGDAGRHHGLPEPGLVEGDLLLAQRVVISGEEVLEVAGHRPGIAGGEGAVGDDVLCVLAQRLVVVPECLRKGQQKDRVEKNIRQRRSVRANTWSQRHLSRKTLNHACLNDAIPDSFA